MQISALLDHIFRWYVLLPIALVVGPLFSYTKIDFYVQNFLLKLGISEKFIDSYSITRVLNTASIGSPFWVAFSAIVIQPMQGALFPLYYVILLSLGIIMKVVYGRSMVDVSDVEGSSKTWVPVWKRKFAVSTEIKGIISNYAYPSIHTLAVMGAAVIATHQPNKWGLALASVIWFVIVNKHWLSDVLSAAALTIAFSDIIQHIK